jgi:hypothetical protein
VVDGEPPDCIDSADREGVAAQSWLRTSRENERTLLTGESGVGSDATECMDPIVTPDTPERNRVNAS